MNIIWSGYEGIYCGTIGIVRIADYRIIHEYLDATLSIILEYCMYFWNCLPWNRPWLAILKSLSISWHTIVDRFLKSWKSVKI